MRTRTILTCLFALTFLGAILPVADATIDTCTQLATTTAPLPVLDLLLATGGMAYMDGSCNGNGVVGGPWPGLAACELSSVHVTASTYCGPIVAAGASVTCTWVGSWGRVDGIAVGFDLDANGHIWHHTDGEYSWRIPQSTPRADIVLDPSQLLGPVLVPVLGSGTYVVPNEWPVPGRVIAYPLTYAGASQSGAAHIGCE